MPGPGLPLADDERATALPATAHGLEFFQVPTPHQGIEDIIATLRFVRDRLLTRFAQRRCGNDPPRYLNPQDRDLFARPELFAEVRCGANCLPARLRISTSGSMS